jgi:hypothetical protein
LADSEPVNAAVLGGDALLNDGGGRLGVRIGTAGQVLRDVTGGVEAKNDWAARTDVCWLIVRDGTEGTATLEIVITCATNY